MNKDVIYIEPEDDITDIITKIENSKEKIIALVPPKKAGVFRSVVNIKLITKSGLNSEKTIVLVTTDPSIVRLAAAVKLPVTKNLQSAPTIPTLETIAEDTAKAEVLEVDDEASTKNSEEPEKNAENTTNSDDKESENDTKANDDPAKEDNTDDNEPEKEDDSKEEEKSKKKSKEKSKDKTKGGWFKRHKKRLIFGGIGLVALILLLVWALVIAPAVNITVWIQTESRNFSENVSFTTNLADEKVEEGKFYLDEKKVEATQEIKFEATGQKNLGEKATGDVVVYTYFKEQGQTPINTGAHFTINGLEYIATESGTLSWDGEDDESCDNAGQTSSLVRSGCQVSTRVKVSAEEPGSKYNIAASNGGWSTLAPVSVYSDKPMSGGSDEMVTVVQQADVLKAKEQLAAANESENKEKLLATVGDDVIVVDASFNQTTSEAVATPAIGEEVKDGSMPVLKATTTATVYTIDKAKVEEFITTKANLSDDQKIYEMNDPFIENFTKSGGGYIGKLKTTYLVGPKVTDQDVLEMAKGRGIGDIQHNLKGITGVVSVDIDTSYPWVMVAPNDSNKITIDIKIKDQNKKESQEKDAKE